MHHTTYASPSSPWQQQQQDLRGHTDVQTDAPAQMQQRSAGSARRVVRRRPRPSRRLPTTYISADPAEFRRMVHQVTGAPEEKHAHLLLPVAPPLDTSAFLLGRARTTHSEALPLDNSFPTLESWDLL